MSKAIFLDIDGVLNAYGTDEKTRSKSRCGSYLGIDKDKVQRLAKIVKETDAILILTSSWKVGWEPKGRYSVDRYDIYTPATNYHAKYLDAHLKKKGKLTLADKTKERNLEERGMGIKAYLLAHPEITEWIVLDDEIFSDFQRRGIMPHLIKTNPYYGLTDEDAEAAIKMLKGQIIGPYISSSHSNEINLNDPFSYGVTIEKEAGPARKE